MSIITEFQISADGFALGDTLRAVPDMRVEGERMVTHSDEWMMPFLWASGGDFDAFETAMEDDSTVESVRTVDAFDTTRLYNIHWNDHIRQIIRAVLNREGIILEVAGIGGEWELKFRFATRTQLSTLREYFAEEQDSFTLKRVFEPSEPQTGTYNLTDKQHEILITAMNSGYYNVPRDLTTGELAEELGISSNATSQRLRRAYATLITNTLIFNEREARTTGSRAPEREQ